jgi:protein transport protein SEC61 subunit gamma-like protein
MSDVNEWIVDPLMKFVKDSKYLIHKCTKPTREEYVKIVQATGIGFLIMGFIGFFVKILHIPIKDILDSA